MNKNIKQLLSSKNDNMRQLGVVLAIGQGMLLSELVDKCIDDEWFYNSYASSYSDYHRFYRINNRYLIIYNFDYEVNRYNVYCNKTNTYHTLTIIKPIEFIKKQLTDLFKEFLDKRNIKYKT